MKFLSIVLCLCLALASKGQTFTPIHNYQAVDGFKMVKYFGIPYGPSPTHNGVTPVIGGVSSQVPGSLFFSTADSSMYHWTGTQWIKDVNNSSVDSLLIIYNNPNCLSRKVSGSLFLVGGFTFQNTDLVIEVACKQYFVPSSIFTIPGPQATNIFVNVWADTSGNMGYTIGPTTPPGIPALDDPGKQVLIGTFLITPTSTTPVGLGAYPIYFEGIEWIFSSNIVGADYLYPTNPYGGSTVSVFVPATTAVWNKGFHFDGDTIPIANFTYFTFQIYLHDTLQADDVISIGFRYGQSYVAGGIQLKRGLFGLNGDKINQWQPVAIPANLYTFQPGSTVLDGATFIYSGSLPDIQFDNIQWQVGGQNNGGVVVIPPLVDSGSVSADTLTYDYWDKRSGAKLIALPTFVKYVYYDSCHTVDTVGRNIYVDFNTNCSGVTNMFVSNDSLYQTKYGANYFVSMVGGGAGGSPNLNVGTGFGVAIDGTNNLKRLVDGFGILTDSTSTANSLRRRVDTSVVATPHDISVTRDIIQQALIDTAAQIRADFPTAGLNLSYGYGLDTLLGPILIADTTTATGLVSKTRLTNALALKENLITAPNTTFKYWTGYKTWGSFLDTARSAISVTGTGMSYNSSTGVITSTAQAALSGTGIVKSTAGTISYLTDPLPVANGGTGTTTPGLVAGTNITSITGTWPNQTINAAGGGGSPALSSITAATATNNIDNAGYRQRWNWSSLAGDTMLILQANTTAAASNAQVGFATILSGNNATTTQTTKAAYFNNAHTGTSAVSYGIDVSATGNVTNIGLRSSASGGSTNYAALFPSGFVGVGTSTPTSTFHILTGENTNAAAFNSATVNSAIYIGSNAYSSFGTTTNHNLLFYVNNQNAFCISRIGGVGIGYASGGTGYNFSSTLPANSLSLQGKMSIGSVNTGLGQLNIAAGTATAGTEPLRFNAGVVLTTPVSGVAETNSTNDLFYTNSGAVRAQVGMWAYIAKTSTYTALNSDYTIDCTSGTFTVTLPTAVGLQGRVYIIKNSGAGTITMAGTSSQTFDGVTSPTIAAGAVAQYQSNNANWIKIN